MMESCGTNWPRSAGAFRRHVEGARGDRLDHVAGAAHLAARETLDLHPAAGLLLHVLGGALDHLRRRVARRLVLRPAQDGRRAGAARQQGRSADGRRAGQGVRRVVFVMIVLPRWPLRPGVVAKRPRGREDHSSLSARLRAFMMCAAPASTAAAASRARMAAMIARCSCMTGTTRSSSRLVSLCRISRTLIQFTR